MWKINVPTIINFEPSKRQYKALNLLLDDNIDELLYGGAGGGGKTYLGCTWLVMMCIKYPESRWLLGRAKLTVLRGSTLNTFFQVCKHNNLLGDGVHYNYNEQRNIITWFNGSEIVLKDLFFKPSDPEFTSLGGLEIAGAYLDEANELHPRAVNIVRSRLGNSTLYDGKEIKTKLLMSCNPNKGFLYKEFYMKHKNNNLETNKSYIPALSTDNPKLSKGRLNALSNLKGIDRQRLLLGIWEYDEDANALIEYDNILALTTNHHIINLGASGNTVSTKTSDNKELKEKYLTCDPAREGKDKMVIWLWHGLNAYKKITRNKSKLNEIVDLIKQLETDENIPRSNVIVDVDGLGSGVTDYLPGCIPFKNGGTPFHNENYTNLKAQCYYKLAEVINNKDMCISAQLDDNEDDEIRAELEQVKAKDIDKDGKKKIVPKEEVKAILGRSPDYSDALMFRMYPLVKSGYRNPDDAYAIYF